MECEPSNPDQTPTANGTRFTRTAWYLAALSYCMLAASLVLPVLHGPGTPAASDAAHWCSQGWFAWLFGWLMLLGSHPLRCDPLLQELLGASSLGFWFVVYAATPLLTGRGLLLTAGLLGACAILGLGWVLAVGYSRGAGLATGYYLWESAMWAMAVACCLAWHGRKTLRGRPATR